MTESSRAVPKRTGGAFLGVAGAGAGMLAVEALVAAGLQPAVPVALPAFGAIVAAAVRGRGAGYAGSVGMLLYFLAVLWLGRFPAFFGNPVAYLWVAGFVGAIVGAGLLRERGDRAHAAERRAVAAEAELATRRALEPKLRASEERLKSLLELSSDWYWEQDAEFRFTSISGPAFPGSSADALGKRRWELAYLADPADPSWDAHRAACERHEEYRGFEFRIRRPTDGALQWVSVSGRPLFDEGGAFVGYRGTASDVTERRRTETLVREQLYFMSALLEAIPQPVVVKGLDGRYLSVNRAFEAAYGVPGADIIGRRATDIKPGVASELHERKDRELLDAGAESLEYEVETRFADGSLRRMLQHKAIYRQADGSVAGIISLGTDISMRYEAERALRESEARFRDVVDATGGFVWETGPDARYTFVSDRVVDVLGYPPRDMVGRKPREFMPEGEAGRVAANVRAQGGWVAAFRSLEHRSVRRDGREVWLRVSAVPVHAPGGAIVGYRGTATDITEAREARERIQRMNEELEARVEDRTADLRATVQELEAFNYTISHDLRAPLRAVNAYALMAIEDYGPLLPDEGRRLLRTAADSARRMAVMLDALLDFSRLARRTIAKVRVPMRALVDEVIEDLRRQSGDGLPELVVGELPDAEGDATLLKQVWSNLLGNAVKYSRTRALPRVEVAWDAAASAYLVRDNGVGIDMAYADKLFGVFQRLHTDAQFEGTGVGLAIVQRIVQRHGGRIWVESRPGEGATFRFTL